MNSGVRILLKSNYIDSNLGFVPLLSENLTGVGQAEWQMSPSEQMGLIYLLEKLRPRVAIEIGTRYGGSLEILSKLSEKVYSFDIDPTVPDRMAGKYPNVEYIIGSSFETVPKLIEKLQNDNAEVSFVLVDGDHTPEGVQRDIENVLKYHPRVPLFLVLHDSFNPECRKGMLSAHWEMNPYVHVVELDFVSGILFPGKELWGGLGLAVLLPEKRSGALAVTGRASQTFKPLTLVHRWSVLKTRVRLSALYRWNKWTSALGFNRKR